MNYEQVIQTLEEMVFEQAKGHTFKNDFRGDFRNEIKETIEKYEAIVSFILRNRSMKSDHE